jgi:hypothetical protein
MHDITGNFRSGPPVSFDNYIALSSALIALIGLLFVGLQLRAGLKQQQAQSLVEIFSTNRELLSLGFDHPKLFEVMTDDETIDPVIERRYLQLWLNQFLLIHTYFNQSVLKGELKDSLIRDLSDFFTQKNMQKHWHRYGRFYPESFQKLVNGILEKIEPPRSATAAQSSS